MPSTRPRARVISERRYISARDKIVSHLEQDKPAFMAGFTDAEIGEFKVVAPALITTKPIVYLVNLSKKNFIAKKSKWLPKIADWVKDHGGGTAGRAEATLRTS